MRFILILILLSVLALNVYAQNAGHIDSQSDGNVIALFGNKDSVEQNLIQKGVENLFFIYNMQMADSKGIKIYGSQEGSSNRVFSVLAGDSVSNYQRIIQKGKMNRVGIFQLSASDSLDSDKIRVNVKQKGNGNSATIIQN